MTRHIHLCDPSDHDDPHAWPKQARPTERRGRRRSLVLAGLAYAVACVLGLGSAAQALPLISEVFYDAVGSDDGWSFVELSGEPGMSLDGLVLTGVNGSNGAVGPTLLLSGSFGIDGLFVVADRMSDGTTFIGEADQLLNFDFQNGYQTSAKTTT